MTFPLRIARITDPIPALELQRRDGTGWFLAPLPSARLRPRYQAWPAPALVFTDTPRPGCSTCHGEGSWSEPYGHPETGEFDGEHDIACACWDPDYEPLLTLRIPPWATRLAHRRRRAAYSEHAPF